MKFRFLILVLVIPLLAVVSCGATLWNRPVADLKTQLAAGNLEVLKNLSLSQISESDTAVLGQGAAWNLGKHFQALNRLDAAEVLWQRSFAVEGAPWRLAAGRDLFDLYAQRRDWAKAEAVAKTLSGFQPVAIEDQRRLFECYYFQKKDSLAWELFQSWKADSAEPAVEAENLLFRGVLAARMGKGNEAAEALSTLIFDRPASELHFRLQSFFQEDPTRWGLLDSSAKAALELQVLVYRGVTKDLTDWLKGRSFPPGFWNHRALISDLETAFKADSRAELGLALLDRFGKDLTGEAVYAWRYAQGRLARSLGWWSQAKGHFQAALGLAANDVDHQMAAWNWLNAVVQLSPSTSLGAFVQVYSSSQDPGFYSDVLDRWITGLIQARRWDVLAAVQRDLGPRMPPEDRSALAFVISRLASYGMIDLKREGIVATPAELLTSVIRVDPFGYEALMARAVLSQDLEWPSQATDRPAILDSKSQNDQTRWLSMIDFGLGREMAGEVADSDGSLSADWVLRAVTALQKQGLYRPSLQLLARWLRQPGATLTKPLAELYYPTAYSDLVVDRATAESLEPSLLWGLMRQESSFDSDAKSWVGAVGLTQLMPATADETARRMKIKSYDLTNPADNVALGARYLSQMIRSQQRIYLALMAYNAGGSRVKTWKQSMGKLPEEIFVEASPFDETRGYVKRILTATVMTGVLHQKKELIDMVKLIYPGFQP